MPPDEGYPEPDAASPPLGRNPAADPVRLHREYVQQRLGGGGLPTPQAYERALDQWHRLPGAVRGPATELHPAVEPTPRADLEFVATPEPATYEGPLPATDPGDDGPYERPAR